MPNDLRTPALMLVKGQADHKLFPLETNVITVGREADICLVGDTAISRIHFEIRFANGRYVLINRSQNGTLVNNRIAEEGVLRNGDRIQVGQAFVLEFTDGSKPVKSPNKSLFKRPLVLTACAAYLMAIIWLFIFLSGTSQQQNDLSAQRVSDVLASYGRYLRGASLSQAERDARTRSVAPYLRSGLIAEREGNDLEARRIYLRLLDVTGDGQNPVYRYALERLRHVPVAQR